MRHGVSASAISLAPGPWASLLDFLCQRFAHVSRADWIARLHRGDVLDSTGSPLNADAPYRSQSLVYYFRETVAERTIPFDEVVLYQDDHLLVVDKPHFLPVVPSGRYLQETLLVRLKRKLGLADLVPVHRIDRDTAGVVMFSVNPQSRGTYVALFRERLVQKYYEAIAPWHEGLKFPVRLQSKIVPSEHFMRMQVLEGEPNSETDIGLIARYGDWAHYSLRPLTGRRHQLRVQMAHLGIPIRDDNIYPVLTPECPAGETPDFSTPLQLLARRLVFCDPLSGDARRFESGLSLRIPPPP